MILREWLAFYSAFLNIHQSGVLTALTWLVPHDFKYHWLSENEWAASSSKFGLSHVVLENFTGVYLRGVHFKDALRDFYLHRTKLVIWLPVRAQLNTSWSASVHQMCGGTKRDDRGLNNVAERKFLQHFSFPPASASWAHPVLQRTSLVWLQETATRVIKVHR